MVADGHIRPSKTVLVRRRNRAAADESPVSIKVDASYRAVAVGCVRVNCDACWRRKRGAIGRNGNRRNGRVIDPEVHVNPDSVRLSYHSGIINSRCGQQIRPGVYVVPGNSILIGTYAIAGAYKHSDRIEINLADAAAGRG